MEGLAAFLRFQNPESYWLFYFTIAWMLAWGGYWIVAHQRRHDPMFRPWPWHRVLGVALVLWPFVRFAYTISVNFSAVLDTTSVARTVPAEAWWYTLRQRTWQYVLVPLVGLFLAFGHHIRMTAPPPLAARVRRLFEEIGLWPQRSLLRDVANGFGLFVLIYFAYLLLYLALSPLQRFDTGDESAVFDALTPMLAFALSLLAGVTEELLFRGILQTRLQRIMPLWGAITIQAVFFGLIHSGYGTIGHIIFPALFGFMMGILFVRFGLLAVIMVHTLIDLVLFLAVTMRLGYRWTTFGVDWTAALIPGIFVFAFLFFAVYHLVQFVRRGGLRALGFGGPADHDPAGPPPEEPEPARRNA